MCPHWVAWKGISYLHPMKLLLLTFQPIFVNVNVRRTKVRALKVQRVRPAVSIHYRFHTQTLWAFLTVPTQALLHPHTHTHTPHTPTTPQHPDCMCSLLSPPAAVYLIHDPTIIRQSPAGPFLARGDTHGDNKIYYFQRNICKWRAGCEVKPPPPCFTKK